MSKLHVATPLFYGLRFLDLPPPAGDLYVPYGSPTAVAGIGVTMFRMKVMRSGRVPPVRRGLGFPQPGVSSPGFDMTQLNHHRISHRFR